MYVLNFLSIARYLGCFHLMTTVNNAVMKLVYIKLFKFLFLIFLFGERYIDSKEWDFAA